MLFHWGKLSSSCVSLSKGDKDRALYYPEEDIARRVFTDYLSFPYRDEKTEDVMWLRHSNCHIIGAQ